MNNIKQEALAIFGVLTDIQYANQDDAVCRKSIRFYRQSIDLVRRAVADWNSMNNFCFILQLGDLIDGKCKLGNESEHAMNLVLDELKSKSNKVYHVWGNHEFYNFSRSYLVKSKLNTSHELSQNLGANANYYSFDVDKTKLRIICLDLYENSILGYKTADPIYQEALKQITNVNKNEDLNSGKNLPANFKSMRALNGGCSIEQFNWLRNQLIESQMRQKKVIICGHIPIHHLASNSESLAWNHVDLLDLIKSFSHENVVVAYLAGHHHSGGYFHDKNVNIHHLTLNAILETKPSSNSYATFKVYDNQICVEGSGKIPSFVIKI